MNKLTRLNLPLVTIFVFLLFLLITFFIPLSTKEHISYCSVPTNLKTRYSIFEKESYDNAETVYSSPGSETMDCIGTVTKIKLYIL